MPYPKFDMLHRLSGKSHKQERKHRNATLQAGVLQIIIGIVFNDDNAVLLAKFIDLPLPVQRRYYA